MRSRARHRLWHAAWLVYAAAGAATVTQVLGCAVTATRIGSPLLFAASTVLTVAITHTRARLLVWPQRGDAAPRPHLRMNVAARDRHGGFRRLKVVWGGAAALAWVGAFAAHVGAHWIAVGDLGVAAIVLLASPPKLLADTI